MKQIGVLLVLLALSQRRASSGPRSPGKIPEGPPTEDNWIPSQPVIPPPPPDLKQP